MTTESNKYIIDNFNFLASGAWEVKMRIGSLFVYSLAIAVLLPVTALAQEGATNQSEAGQASAITEYSPVTNERLLNPEPENWLMYRGTYNTWGHSPLEQVNKENVKDLVPVWSFSSGLDQNHEAPPIVNDGIMFVTTSYNRLYALDAATGELLWSYVRELAEDVFPVVCCDVVNRGVALYQDKVYMTTLDAHLLAFDAKTGRIVWDKTVEDYLSSYTMTLAPLVVKDKVMVGVSGGEYGIRGFIEAFDAKSGKSAWKTYTIPGPGEPGNETWPGDTWQTGGAPAWITGSYDPELDLTYWGTGNGGPWMGTSRPGDNLYVASVIAMDPDTGEIKNHFQYSPNETWDYDEVSDTILVDDVEIDGETRQVAFHFSRSGFLYALDQANMEFIYAKPMTGVTSLSQEKEGSLPIPAKIPDVGKEIYTCPAALGAKNWWPGAYSPVSGLLYTSIAHFCMDIAGTEIDYRAGQIFIGATTSMTLMEGEDKNNAGEFAAFDPKTGEKVWSNKYPFMQGSVLTSGGGLVFTGGTPQDRYFRAFDDETGEELWKFRTNSGVFGVPSSYEVDGVQYIAVWSGWEPQSWTGWPIAAEANGLSTEVPQGGVLWVFALKE